MFTLLKIKSELRSLGIARNFLRMFVKKEDSLSCSNSPKLKALCSNLLCKCSASVNDGHRGVFIASLDDN